MKAIRIALICLAAAGASLILFIVMALFSHDRDPFDKARVVSVRPSPNGRMAAVLYSYSHANSSVTTVWLAVSQMPFPAVGADYDSKDPIAGIYHAAIRGARAEFDDLVLRSPHVAWTETSVLQVCPATDVELLYFAKRGPASHMSGYAFTDDESFHEPHVHFCDREMQTTPAAPGR